MIFVRRQRIRLLAATSLILSLALGISSSLFGQDESQAERGVATPSIAVFPIWDRSANSAPAAAIEEDLRLKLQFRGFSVLDPGIVEKFLRRYRIRFTGGINGSEASALRAETGVAAVLLTSIDLYQEANPPKLGITARLVTTTEDPRILWMESAIRSGDEAPGLLGLGLIHDFDRIQEKVVRQLAKSFYDDESAATSRQRARRNRNSTTSRRFRPKAYFYSEDFPAIRDRAQRVAVLPMANTSGSRYAGEIVTDQIIRHLVRAGVDVIEPGVVRRVLLETRQIYTQGPSVPDTDILRIDLEADIALYGEVARYREAGPANPYPLIDFSLRAIDTRSQEVIWSSISYSKGADGVFFFDVGSVSTAHDLASKMAQAMVKRAAN